MAKQSNRLVIQLDRLTLGGAYLEGIQNINANSSMVNQLVIRVGRWTGERNDDCIYDDPNSKFTLQQLSIGETLWVYFKKHGEPKTVHSCMLKERNITRFSETAEVDYEVGQEEIKEEGKEYWIYIPDPVMRNPGQWDFSFAIKHVATRETDDEGNVTYTFDYQKTSSQTNPFNLIVNPSLVDNDDDNPVTNVNVAALYEQATSAVESAKDYAKQAQEDAKFVAEAVSEETERAKQAETELDTKIGQTADMLQNDIEKESERTGIVMRSLQEQIINLAGSSCASLSFTVDPSTFILTIKLYNKAGETLSTKSIDLPLESVVVNGEYDSATQSIILTLQNGNTVPIPVGDIIAGLATTKYVDETVLKGRMTWYAEAKATTAPWAISATIEGYEEKVGSTVVLHITGTIDENIYIMRINDGYRWVVYNKRLKLFPYISSGDICTFVFDGEDYNLVSVDKTAVEGKLFEIPIADIWNITPDEVKFITDNYDIIKKGAVVVDGGSNYYPVKYISMHVYSLKLLGLYFGDAFTTYHLECQNGDRVNSFVAYNSDFLTNAADKDGKYLTVQNGIPIWGDAPSGGEQKYQHNIYFAMEQGVFVTFNFINDQIAPYTNESDLAKYFWEQGIVNDITGISNVGRLHNLLQASGKTCTMQDVTAPLNAFGVFVDSSTRHLCLAGWNEKTLYGDVFSTMLSGLPYGWVRDIVIPQ